MIVVKLLLRQDHLRGKLYVRRKPGNAVKEVFILGGKKDTFMDNPSAGWHGIKIGRGCQESTLVFSEKILPGRTVVGIIWRWCLPQSQKEREDVYR